MSKWHGALIRANIVIGSSQDSLVIFPTVHDTVYPSIRITR